MRHLASGGVKADQGPLMAAPPRKRRVSAERRRALELLASSRHGVNEALLVHGHGISKRLIAGLVRSGLAVADRDVMKAAGSVAPKTRV